MRGPIAIAAIILMLVPQAIAQTGGGLLQGGPGTGEPLSMSRGTGVFHGNYCGVGDNGPGLPPVDELDRACMHHDACTPEGGLPTCDCNARFLSEVRAVAQADTVAEDVRSLAGTVESLIPVIPCH